VLIFEEEEEEEEEEETSRFGDCLTFARKPSLLGPGKLGAFGSRPMSNFPGSFFRFPFGYSSFRGFWPPSYVQCFPAFDRVLWFFGSLVLCQPATLLPLSFQTTISTMD